MFLRKQVTIEHMNRSTRLHPGADLQATNPEVALHASHDPSFKTARNEANDHLDLLDWEVVLNDESVPTTDRWATAVHEEEPVEYENRPIESRRTENERCHHTKSEVLCEGVGSKQRDVDHGWIVAGGRIENIVRLRAQQY